MNANIPIVSEVASVVLHRLLYHRGLAWMVSFESHPWSSTRNRPGHDDLELLDTVIVDLGNYPYGTKSTAREASP